MSTSSPIIIIIIITTIITVLSIPLLKCFPKETPLSGTQQKKVTGQTPAFCLKGT
jgi:hypothetical protein